MVLRFLFNFLLLSAVVNLYGAEKISTPEIKVAIVAQDVKGESLTDAVTAELSGRNVICVERTEIKKILAEQKLSADGLVDPANIVKCCQLLKVDLFTVIICSPKTRIPVGIIVFDTRLGLRLADIGLPEKFDDQVKLTADTVTAAIARQQQLNAGKLKLISFMPLNLIALKGMEADSARLAELVLMRLLGQNQSILLLERSQLDFLLKERSLHPDNDNQLLAGSLFIQLEPELSGDKAKPLTLKLFAKDITGKVYFSLRETYAIDDEVKAAEHLAAETGRQLGTTVVTGNFDRKTEAVKYINECKLAQANGMYERASRMARNAYALNPAFRQDLIRIETEIAKAYLSHLGSEPPPQEDMEAAVEHAEFLFEIDDNSFEIEMRLEAIMLAFASISDYYFNKMFSPQLKARIIALRKQAAILLLRSYNQRYKPINKISSTGDMQDIIRRITVINRIAEVSRDNEINNTYGLPLKELYVANIDRFYTPEISLDYRGFELFTPGRAQTNTSRLTELYRAMQKTSVPYFKIIGTLHLYALNYPSSNNDSSYNDFMIGVIERDHIPDQDWKYLISFWRHNMDNYLQMAPGKHGLELCRSIYKIRGYDRDLFSGIHDNGESDAVEIYSFMKEIQQKAKNDKKMTTVSRNEVIEGTKHYIRDLEIRFSKLRNSVQEAPEEDHQIYKRIFNVLPKSKEQFSCLSQPLYNNNKIYVVRINTFERFLYRVSPEHGFSSQAGEKLIVGPKQIDSYSTDAYFACLSKDYYIMASSAGLFLFPLNLLAPKYVPVKEFNGFRCYAITCLNEKVYMAYDGSTYERKTPLFLVEYDLHKKSYSVIYSSNQSEKNPFINCDLRRFSRMYADTVRDRLIVPVWRTSGATEAELWALNLTSRSWAKLTDIPHFPLGYNNRYSPFIIGKNENTLIIMGDDVVYEFNLISNQIKLIFFSGYNCDFRHFQPSDNSAKVEDFAKWKVKVGQMRCVPVDLDGNKLWTEYFLILLDRKKALKLISNQGDNHFYYVYFKMGNFVVGSSNSCVPNGSLMAMELKDDSELLNLPELEDIAP